MSIKDQFKSAGTRIGPDFRQCLVDGLGSTASSGSQWSNEHTRRSTRSWSSDVICSSPSWPEILSWPFHLIVLLRALPDSPPCAGGFRSVRGHNGDGLRPASRLCPSVLTRSIYWVRWRKSPDDAFRPAGDFGQRDGGGDLIADQGLDGTKSEDIASVAGISKATLYYYFDGKEAVLSHIFGVLLDALGDAVNGAVDGPGECDGAAPPRRRRPPRYRRRLSEGRPRPALRPRARRPPARDRREDSCSRTSIPSPACFEDGATDGTIRPLRQPRLGAMALLAATTTAAIMATSIDGIGDLNGVKEMIFELFSMAFPPQATSNDVDLGLV